MSNDAMLKRAKELVVNYSFTRGGKWSMIKQHPYEVFYSEKAALDILKVYNYEWKDS